MNGPSPLIPSAITIAIALTAALTFESRFDISFRPRQPKPPLVPLGNAADAGTGSVTARPALALRLVDSGGVGIPLNAEWGADYSHERRVFHDVILKEAPYVDAGAFHRVELEWRT